MNIKAINHIPMINIFQKPYLIISLSIIIIFTGCDDFFNPDQELVVEKKEYFNDWNEYRAAEMGLYAIQQDLAEQMFILGELRGDLLQITPNATRDLIEVYNFEISKNNKYASPVNFYRLIGACNSLKNQLEKDHPEVLDKSVEPTRYDRMYGEVLCMRAWAYFNAARIYNKVPYIHASLTQVNEIEEYVQSPKQYIDSMHVDFAPDGYHVDVTMDTNITLEKTYLDMDAVIDTFTHELENEAKAVGVIHNKDFNDPSWDVTVWNTYAWHSLLGQMYLYDYNYNMALKHFDPIMYNFESETNFIKFGIDEKFRNRNWRNIITSIDPFEHIYTLWFNKSNQQKHELQTMLSIIFPNQYMLKPTKIAVQNWENMWDGMRLDRDDDNPQNTQLVRNSNNKPIRGTPGDFYRGYGVSYGYIKDGELMEEEDIREMLEEKAENNLRVVDNIMKGADTVVYKYTIGKNEYDNDANFMVYRAADIHFYFAEIQIWRVFFEDNFEKRQILKSLQVINDGTYNNEPDQLGIRGRVGFADGHEDIEIGNVVYEHDPATNHVIGFRRLRSLSAQQKYLEDQILQEKARELAYEGERFFDLMRAAKRRGQPEYLAEKVAAKFSGAKREQIKQKLMNEENWYIPLFEEY